MPKDERFNLDGYFHSLYSKAPQSLRLLPTEDISASQDKLRAALREVLALKLYGPTDTPPKAVLLSSELCEGDGFSYTREKYSLEIAPELNVPLFLLKPAAAAGKLPVVITLHGHGKGVSEILSITDPYGNPSVPGSYQDGFAVQMVKRGFLVAAPELIGFGESRLFSYMKDGVSGGDCYPVSANLLTFGGSCGGLRVFEAIRVLDHVLSLSSADSSRVGAIGISGGGTVTANLSAADTRVSAAVVSGYANFYRTSILAIHHCIDNFLPDILKYAELPDVLGLIAPRPLLISSGSEDHIFPVSATRECEAYLRRVYALYGCEDNLETDYFTGGHKISGDRLFNFLADRLN